MDTDRAKLYAKAIAKAKAKVEARQGQAEAHIAAGGGVFGLRCRRPPRWRRR
jgi:hypothetical protein